MGWGCSGLRCAGETQPLPRAQAAPLLLLLLLTPGHGKHHPDPLCTVSKPGSTSCFSSEKRRNIQSLELEEDELKPNLQQAALAEHRWSSSDRSVRALHIVLSLINTNKDLRFSEALAFEDG